ncbi:hypothetical protein QYE76_044338 [Lolium multiflorum]|uniref:EF-hand domain-containing protein n=1 Tax=Lolium multiflorum TaxID=4521 RepID=A0AAD8WWN1_LOLMU|nr:hypothetical protein QYE76_044338 [Lolium multiflorum]
MAGGRRSSVAASLQLPSVSALLLLTIFSSNWGHAVAKFDPANMTALQEHVSFFDRNKDGIITPAETFEGFVAIGCEIAFSTAAATAIHTALAFKTTPAGAPLPYINIYVENIHKAIHGGDTGVYDAKGRWGYLHTAVIENTFGIKLFYREANRFVKKNEGQSVALGTALTS